MGTTATLGYIDEQDEFIATIVYHDGDPDHMEEVLGKLVHGGNFQAIKDAINLGRKSGGISYISHKLVFNHYDEQYGCRVYFSERHDHGYCYIFDHNGIRQRHLEE